jgi:hypothetical protein
MALPLAAAPKAGRIAGVVVDPAGTPQMGATVLVSSEGLLTRSAIELLTNDRGHFRANSAGEGDTGEVRVSCPLYRRTWGLNTQIRRFRIPALDIPSLSSKDPCRHSTEGVENLSASAFLVSGLISMICG